MSTSCKDSKRTGEQGNAIIFILLSVMLFAALAYTFMRGSQTGQSNLTAGQAKLAAQEIMEYSNRLGRAVEKLQGRGCSENGLSFVNSYQAPLDYTNISAPADNSCDIFNEAGGNITANAFRDYMVSAASRTNGAPMFLSSNAINDLGTANSELLFVVPDLRAEVCQAINIHLNISGDMPAHTIDATPYQGSYPAALQTLGTGGTNPAAVTEKNAFCLLNGTSYSFVRVLIER
ncbi:MAG: hypothetical protein DI551_04825 [Micavibrio aeruginosavorus]|uniref:Uncharacterized protein n=1 Tax=Micavibrio aeruginosavorus TaxID=349221 RepID=A0A2W5MZN6_9BACT|nr:MAG: hypothetical protein DI551_04825 [Micavibrio aeruginosavorus]